MPRTKPAEPDVRHFIVEGRAQAKQRPRMYRGVAYTPQQTKDYEAKMRNTYVETHGDADPFLCDLYVEVNVFFRNKQHGDLDNYIKTLDGLNKVAWKDDKLIKEIHATLTVDKEQAERMEITIRPM